ncbi:PE family protein, partial [Paenibacillus elgii]
VPEMLAAAAKDIAGVGSTLNSANALAAANTTAVAASAADQVSAAVASLFSGHAQQYQAFSSQFAAFHEQFVQTLAGAAGSYAGAEASAVQTLQRDVLGAINAPTQALLGRPLIGDGADGTAANANGGAGGLLYGNG